jgi:hypothetical protein
MPQDELLRDPRAHPVELRGAVGRLPEQHEPRIADPLEQAIELGVVDPVERLGALGDQLGGLCRLLCGV